MQDQFLIREIQLDEIELILPLAMKSWKYTYKNIYSEDFIENYVNRAYRKESLQNIKEQSRKGLTLFVVLVNQLNGNLVGFAQVGYDRFWESGEKALPLRLFRIYLDPAILGRGLGSLLLEKVEEFVRKTGEKSYIVGVHENNSIGLRFYEKMGFMAILKESDAEGEIYYKKELN